jgi:hypothetical protein
MKREEIMQQMSETLALAREYGATYTAMYEAILASPPAKRNILLQRQQQVLVAWLAQMEKYRDLSAQYLALTHQQSTVIPG